LDVQSHFASHEKGADAWTDKAHDKSNEIAYGADGPADYTVEPAVLPEALAQWGNLAQYRKRGIYKVKDAHSYINPYDQRDHSFTEDQHDVSDEV